MSTGDATALTSVSPNVLELVEGEHRWQMQFPSNWTVIEDDHVGDWASAIPVVVNAALEEWATGYEADLDALDDDERLEIVIATQAEVVAGFRDLCDDHDVGVLAYGVDVLGDEGSVLVTNVGVSVLRPDRDVGVLDGAAVVVDEPGRRISRQVVMAGDDADDVDGRGADLVFGQWLIEDVATDSTVLVRLRSAGDGAADLLGVGQFIAKSVTEAGRTS